MILRREIERLAESKELSKNTVDKDWVLGHFIDGIYSIPECRDNLIFKGGTCLRKCYFTSKKHQTTSYKLQTTSALNKAA